MLMQAAKGNLRIDEIMKTLFRSDISRNFGMAFVLGAVIVLATDSFDGQQDWVAPVQAATVQAAPISE